MTSTVTDWTEANQRHLLAALDEVRALIERRANPADGAAIEEIPPRPAAEDANASVSSPFALERLCADFQLSAFERRVLVLAAGVEVDSSFARLCAAAAGIGRPTFGLALAAFPGAHWSALSPAGPLRYWRLIELDTQESLASSPLRIDERILHFLTGVSYLDDRLRSLVTPVVPSGELPPSQRVTAEAIAAAWLARQGATLPAVQLEGEDPSGRRSVAAAACTLLGLMPYAISAHALPVVPAEFEAFVRLWEREAVLSPSALILEIGGADLSDPASIDAVTRVVENVRTPLMVAGSVSRHPLERALLSFPVGKPTAVEQCALWREVLGTDAASLNGQVETLTGQFNLSAAKIRAAGFQALQSVGLGGAAENGETGPNEITPAANRDSTESPPTSPQELGAILWEACREQTRPRLEALAQRLRPVANWDNLILPAPQQQTLREIAVQARHRFQVYERWGFAGQGTRGLGISALFHGPSGTGKTLAAEVLAQELRLDLYRIDLSQVVSKYIGETEKNLARLFDAAEEAGAVLFFDEADALFGKRSEVKDSHDRYANIEISYLLQRMEAYRGLAILATNLKSALDRAFLRRLRFVVEFPFPDVAQRAEIWRRIFPAQTPTEQLDTGRLARLNIAGGSIRNIALHAAFLAADSGEPVGMKHIFRAARSEYIKLEKPLTELETGGRA